MEKGYPLTCRGTINVKGKGDMETYFLDDKTKFATNVTFNPIFQYLQDNDSDVRLNRM